MRRASWLGLAFFLRGNRHKGPRLREAVGPDGQVRDGLGPEDTTRSGASGPAPAPTGSLALRVLGALLLSLSLGLVGYGVRHLLHHSRSFAIRQVRISPTAHVTHAALVERADVPLGTNLFLVDTGRVRAALSMEPWLKSVRVRRELPATLAIDVVEYEPRALLSLGSVYLIDGDGVVFKRATPDEARGLPVLTGIHREDYLSDRAESIAQIKEALAALSAYTPPPGAGDRARPPLGEVHLDLFAGTTLYTDTGVSIRLGHTPRDEWPARLARFDAVFAELQRGKERAAIIYLDNRAHPDHVTVKFEEPRAQAGGEAR